MFLSRRKILGGIGIFTTAALAGFPAFAHNDDTGTRDHANPVFFWKPRKLDPAESAKIAYEGYWNENGGAAFGVFYGIVGQMGMKHGAPYNSFPFHMLSGRNANIVDKGVICAELNGASYALSLFWNGKERAPLEARLHEWYEKTELPVYNPGELRRHDMKIVASQSNSILHHLSIGKWCHVADASPVSDVCNERCARVTADVAFKTAELINDKIDNG